MKTNVNFSYRFLARIVIEAETSLALGSGERNVLTDRLVAKDVNNLPYIPGTSLAGVLRQSFLDLDRDLVNNLFGFQNGEDGIGSRIIVSAAHMIGNNGKVIDGIKKIDFSDNFYSYFINLPIRQHVRISHQGGTEKGGKFDEQVVYKGTRFCFELELIGNNKDEENWNYILELFSNPSFRIGGGTRKGFGAIRIVKCLSEIIDLTENLEKYLSKSSSLTDENNWWNQTDEFSAKDSSENKWIVYELKLNSEDFFLFGSGLGSEDADMSFVKEKIVIWDEKTGFPNLSDEKVLIPATSVKGALAHRTAFHFNKTKGIYSDTLMKDGTLEFLFKVGFKIPETLKNFDSKSFEDRTKLITEGNPAVRGLFGFSANDYDGQRGRVIFSDVFVENNPVKTKLLNHVAIDRFTGGAMDGALFSEEVISSNASFNLKIVAPIDLNNDYILAFEAALNDLISGNLPLGGGTMRGHGRFHGTMERKTHSK